MRNRRINRRRSRRINRRITAGLTAGLTADVVAGLTANAVVVRNTNNKCNHSSTKSIKLYKKLVDLFEKIKYIYNINVEKFENYLKLYEKMIKTRT